MHRMRVDRLFVILRKYKRNTKRKPVNAFKRGKIEFV
jgi:hypothetical protein